MSTTDEAAIEDLELFLVSLSGFSEEEGENDTSERAPLRIEFRQDVAKVIELAVLLTADSTTTEESNLKNLVDVEIALKKLRHSIAAYMASLPKELSELTQLFDRSIHTIHCKDPELAQQLYQTFVPAYRQHVMNEMNELRQLDKQLDDFYDENGSDNISVVSQSSLSVLKRTYQRVSFTDPLLHKLSRQTIVRLERLLSVDSVDSEQQLVSTKAFEKPEPTVHYQTVTAKSDPALVACASAEGAISSFLEKIPERQGSFVTSILVAGSEGSGKTHLCNRLEIQATQRHHDIDCIVIRPQLPLDILGRSVGETEDTIMALFRALIHSSPSKRSRVMILDGLEHILTNEEDASNMAGSSSGNSSRRSRSQSTFCTMMDFLRTHCPVDASVLVFATSSNDSPRRCTKFDRVYTLGLPTDTHRREILSRVIVDASEDVLQNLIESTEGQSFAELLQNCRLACQDAAIATDSASLADLLQERLHTSTPPSLRTGEEVMDLHIWTSRDLARYELPELQGISAKVAWKALQSSIIVPLCHGKELDRLLYATSSETESPKSVIGGALLVGESGSGKTTLAMHCARNAASLLPSIKLLDVSCTSLIHKELGGSERAVRQLFAIARRVAPCIVLLEGIENICAVRGNDMTTEGTMDRVLSTVLTEMDGVERGGVNTGGGIAILGVTRKESWIDPALKRPGRLDRTLKLLVDW